VPLLTRSRARSCLRPPINTGPSSEARLDSDCRWPTTR
jgi:hypothetical protein